VADVTRLRDIAGDLDTDTDAVEERVPRVENDWVPLEEADLDDATERDPVDEAVLVLVVLIEAVIVFVIAMVLVRRGELVPDRVMAIVIVCCGEDDDDFVGGVDRVDVLVEVAVLVDSPDCVEIWDGQDVNVTIDDLVEVFDGTDVCVGTTMLSRRILLSGGVELTRPIANNMRDQRMLFYIRC